MVVRTRSVDALIDLGGNATDALVRALCDSSEEIRISALASLGELGIPRTTDAIKELLTDESMPVRLQAAGVLGRFGHDSGMPLVERCLGENDELTRRAAVAYGWIVGQTFSPTADGVAEARRHLDVNKKNP